MSAIKASFLKQEETGLWIVDVQENLFSLVEHSARLLKNIIFFLQAAKELSLPIFVTEQYPEGLGTTLSTIKDLLPQGQVIHEKTVFSGYKSMNCVEGVNQTGVSAWILMGIETHICVLQTAKDLLNSGKQVVILQDAVSARSSFDSTSALMELRECGVRITTTETVVYELLRDASTSAFKAILPLIKAHA